MGRFKMEEKPLMFADSGTTRELECGILGGTKKKKSEGTVLQNPNI